MREAINNLGTMCPVRVVGILGMVISHTCVECMTSPLGRFMNRGFVARQTSSMRVLAITKMEVTPVLAMACVGENDTIFVTGRADATTCGRDLFEATAVASSQLISMGSGAHVEISQLI
jgi:hypothetical protein